jgi:hypothetical protein
VNDPDDINHKSYLRDSNTWLIDTRLAELGPEARSGDLAATIESILLTREKWHRQTWWFRQMSFSS